MGKKRISKSERLEQAEDRAERKLLRELRRVVSHWRRRPVKGKLLRKARKNVAMRWRWILLEAGQ